MSKFKSVEYDKELVVTGPFDLNMSIDFDDVDHKEVRRQTRHLVAVLNKYWDHDIYNAE